jgi:hypothetical protein
MAGMNRMFSVLRIALLDNSSERSESVERHIRQHMSIFRPDWEVQIMNAPTGASHVLEMAAGSDVLIIGNETGKPGNLIDRQLALLLRNRYRHCQVVVMTLHDELLEALHLFIDGVCEYLLVNEEFLTSLSGILNRKIHELSQREFQLNISTGNLVPLKVTNQP